MPAWWTVSFHVSGLSHHQSIFSYPSHNFSTKTDWNQYLIPIWTFQIILSKHHAVYYLLSRDSLTHMLSNWFSGKTIFKCSSIRCPDPENRTASLAFLQFSCGKSLRCIFITQYEFAADIFSFGFHVCTCFLCFLLLLFSSLSMTS